MKNERQLAFYSSFRIHRSAFLYSVHYALGRERYVVEGKSERLLDRVEDCGRGAIHRQLTDSLRAAGAARVRVLEEVHGDGGDARGGRDVVFRHLPFRPPPPPQNPVLVELPPDALRDAALYLPRRKHWM